MNRRTSALWLLAALAVSPFPATALAQSDSKPDGAKARDARRDEKERAKRFEKLDRDDRAALDAVIGYVAPEFTSSIDWIGDAGAPSMKSLRGKVVVIQTFTTKSGAARALPDKVAKALADFKPDDVRIIAIHTPENADKADAQLEKSKSDVVTGIDRDGSFCDLIGAYKKPVNLVIDRTGDVKVAGLTTDGLVDTVKELVAQPYDPANKPTERPKETSTARKDFPTFSTPVDHAIDLRGKQAPRVPNSVEWWWNRKPDPQNRLVIVDFWATWCGPCKKAIPHMNEIAKQYSRDVACMGISDEAPQAFDRGLKTSALNPTSFEYAVGTDPSGTMKKAFGITAIPHVVVISSDWIVRWQGHPDGLTADVVKMLIDANRSLNAGTEAGDRGDRWKRDSSVDKDRGGAGKGKNRDSKKSS
ncbi:MAG: TlpA family protein disulfide reductase [Phycisphaerales bacterium]